jgi:hypothetical protein
MVAISTFVSSDTGNDNYSLNSPAVAETIRPYPGKGLANVTLITGDNISTFALVGIAVVALGVVAVVAWLVLRRKRRVVRGSTAWDEVSDPEKAEV